MRERVISLISGFVLQRFFIEKRERGDEQEDKDKINGQCQSGDGVILTH